MSREETVHDSATLDYKSLLKAETGYSTFQEYLESRGSPHMIHPSNQREEQRKVGLAGATNQCLIIDISKKSDSAQKLDVRQDLSCSETSTEGRVDDDQVRNKGQRSAIELIDGLKLPVNEDSIRTILWYMPDASLNMEWVDVLFLLLKIPPSFLETLIWAAQQRFKRLDALDKSPLHIFDLHYLSIGDFFVILLDDSVFAEGPMILIVLLASPDILSSIVRRSVREWISTNTPSRTTLAPGENVFLLLDKAILYDHHKAYARLLEHVLERDSSFDYVAASLACTVVYSILIVQMIELQERYRDASMIISKPMMDDETSTALHYQRYILRRTIETFQDDLQTFRSYVTLQNQFQILSTPQFQEYEERWNRVAGMSRRLEAEMRDQMQLATGKLSVDESRKSIELSNVQITEGKQVKIFTILAFVYVPLNLATSIFGMNVQQLNSSGQQIKVVIFTALVSMFLTGTLWWAVARVNYARQWLLTGEEFKFEDTTVSRYDAEHRDEPNYSIEIRLAMLYYLAFHREKAQYTGYGLRKPNRWIFRSNAWAYILLNSRSECLIQDVEDERRWRPSIPRPRTASHFAAYCVRERIRWRPWFENRKWPSPWTMLTWLGGSRKHPESPVNEASTESDERRSV